MAARTCSVHHLSCYLLQIYNQMKTRHAFLFTPRHSSTSIHLPLSPKPPFFSFVNSCSSLIDSQIIHTKLIKCGNYSDGFAGDQLVCLYAKFGSINAALQLFDEIPNKDLVSWNSFISVFSRNGDVNNSFGLFRRMRRELGIQPNDITLISLLPGCVNTRSLHEGKCIHVYATKLGFLSETKVIHSVIHVYGKCGFVDSSCRLFEEILFRNLVSWNSLMAVHVQNGLAAKGIGHFNSMRREEMKPDRATVVTILQAFGDLAAIRPGRTVHAYIINSGFSSDVPVATALISAYSKCGSLEASYQLFVQMNNPDKLAWTVMLACYSIHGNGREAIDCFSLMVKEGIRPDHVTFTHVLNACSHSGLIEEGKMYFESMSKIYGVTPRIDHYSCMVDLLGRSGHLDEARELIESMPIEPNAGVWGALIGACRAQRNIKVGKEVAERLFALEPSDPRNYIILSNIYSAAGQWKEASKVRALMKERGLRKDPGYSFIEHGGHIRCFSVGDQSHPDSKEIYAKLDEVILKIQKAGYVPDTEFVLHDVDEEAKKQMIYKHGEKLAIAFGLLVNDAGIPIVITKNLRICGDCHTAAKFISLIEKCTIIVRDSKRFHHFANGLCSCRDYW